MQKNIVLLVLTGSGLLLAPLHASEPIFIQAEAFTCDGTSWTVRDQASRYAPDSGLKHLAGAIGGPGMAWRDVEISEAGSYVVWVRHTTMRGGRGPFTVSMQQGNTVLGAGTFDHAPPDVEPRRIHRYDFSHFEVDLPVGVVRIEITKEAPVACPGWTRLIDCLLLTTDTEYTPRVSDFQPKTWLRVTLGPTVGRPVYVHCFADHYRAPWYKHFSLSNDGYEERVTPRRGQAAFLSAREQTPWCDITSVIHEDRGARLELRLAEKYSYTEWLPSCDALFEFATAPEDSAIVKRFERRGNGAGLSVVTPGVLNREGAALPQSDRELFDVSRTFAAALPSIPFGHPPERFPFFLSIHLRPRLYAPEVRLGELRIVASLGFNGLQEPLGPELQELGFRFSRAATTSWYMKDQCYLQPQREKIRERVTAAAAGWAGQPPSVAMFMDEPTARPLVHAQGCPVCREKFVTWLRDELRVPLAALGHQSWSDVRPTTRENRDETPALYYHSQRFRSKSLADFLRLQTSEIERAYGSATPATVNFSDGAVYRANMYLQGVDYFHVFGTAALSMAWSEDWNNLGSTYQCAGYNVDLLRAACRRQGQPVGMYLITSSGRTPLDVKLKAYSSIGRGVRTLQSYAYGIPYASHHIGWYMNRDVTIAIKELSHEIGGAEDLLLQATRSPSSVAFLYSTTSDIWTLGENELYGHDRMHTYLALMHAQVPVDFLSEQDVIDGHLDSYRVLYLFGPNLAPGAAPRIAEWTRAGGTLLLAAGAATADEYNRPARPLDQPLGLSRGKIQTLQTHTTAGRDLRNLTPHGKVQITSETADILGMRQLVELSPGTTGSVLGRGDDEAGLFISCDVGQGHVFALGFMPSLSYIRKALIARDTIKETVAVVPENALGIPGPASVSSRLRLGPSYNPVAYPKAER
ncbi:MAG: hypothetical protein HON70_34140, partial [Lentisphaerae bacterium]|nr:hypothetical protein [Lentisphaerota bacterium]